MAKARKLRSGIEEAKGLYEEWMEPDWRGSTTAGSNSTTEAVQPKNRSKFKFASEYQRDLSTASKSVLNPQTLPTERRIQNQKSRELNWKPVDFEKFYRWVTNGTLKDLYKAKSLLFED
ncbi:unnamed protein product [Bursaphelenchus xylophilus]|uniref:(pine wood nematode) hypothetical protein n=1 Tax=Bursaphelenchus xylophilus TaxID=6326 RepID=A0A1I7S724_BURXY|nr:unnamed protein product [Bursaphelenchus xylophilus]CAG9084515.1 unnamed protein product [Bursaphelenchus xylophilus]